MSRDIVVREPLRATLPMMGVIVAWIVLWLLWPSVSASPDAKTPSGPVTRYVFLASPGNETRWSPPIIAWPSKHGWSHALREEIENEDALSPVRTDTGRLLMQTPPLASGGWPAQITSVADNTEEIVAPYKPLPMDMPVFSSLAKTSGVMFVEASAELSAMGPSMSGLLTNDVLRTDKRWVVQAHIETSDDGRTSHVFLELPSGDNEVDQAVIRLLYLARLAASDGPSSGLVVVSWSGKTRARPGGK